MPATQPMPVKPAAKGENPRPPAPVLYQKYFKSSGPRTYAAQVKEASNGNHFLVLTEGKRDPKTDELRKSMIFVFAEDFAEFFRMLHETAQFIKANPVPEAARQRRAACQARTRSDRGQPRGKGAD